MTSIVLGGGASSIDRVTHLGTKTTAKFYRSRSMSSVDAFYKASNSDYTNQWKCSETGALDGKIPSISEILDGKDPIRRPVRPLVDTGRFLLTKAKMDELKASKLDPILSAHIAPHKFPISAYEYPKIEKRGAENPLYFTSNTACGKETPMKHQLPDLFFPRDNHFSSTFTDLKPRDTGLSTRPNFSKIHEELDRFK
eukprot:gnl/MRDRNA2_/MRDRNA2_108322_c0_seq1.p1 gnl/MRDRNA2_/MRDRNA2_108322_c0~~gnl/MRDRNA2_/MRDRNA2_108322_c0_seq1.p1  ORF type:complete len:219 (+),score=34.63 gnl/MRDRNA2_/MRDRNA2_108322_c0_seq1:69-659(+)